MQGKPFREATPGHAGTHGIEEEMLVSTMGSDSQPVAQDPAGFLPQRQDTMPPALTDDVHLVEGRHLEVVERKPDQLRDP